jgi:hypothetical protein
VFLIMAIGDAETTYVGKAAKQQSKLFEALTAY